MANIFNVARYILGHLGAMSTWKLQKLCYYSQAWSIAWTEHPIFNEDFEAWANGPVCPELFKTHKGKFYVDLSNIPEDLEDDIPLSEDQTETIDLILEHYGSYEPYELREQSHSENPWKDARGNIPEGEWCNNIITKNSMGLYYGSL